jgi:hypothetical protein
MRSCIIASIIVLLLAGGLYFYSQAFGLHPGRGSGNVITQNRPLEAEINRVKFDAQGKLIIEQSNNDQLSIEAEDNAIPFIKTEVVKGELRISMNNFLFFPSREIYYHLKVKDLSAVSIESKGSVKIDKVNIEQFGIDISGSGSLDIKELNVKNLSIVLSGSGDADISGKVEKQFIDISGSGKYFGEGLAGRDADVNISGSGNASIAVSDFLDVRISGSGNLQYSGQPNIEKQLTGSGQLLPNNTN